MTDLSSTDSKDSESTVYVTVRIFNISTKAEIIKADVYTKFVEKKVKEETKC